LLTMTICLKPKLKLILASSKIGKMWRPNNFRPNKKSTGKILEKCSSKKVKWRKNLKKTLKSPSKSWISKNLKEKNNLRKMNNQIFRTIKTTNKNTWIVPF
jgi:hypothetical protein